MRLEIGSGYSPTPGFTHLDMNPNAPGVDIVGPAFPLPMATATVDEIRAVDVLEHLSYWNTEAALSEWARVLRPGGKLYVQVPDADLIMRWYVLEPARLIDRIPDGLLRIPIIGAAWRLLGGHSDGVAVKSGDDWKLNAHYALFSPTSLRDALHATGFDVEQIEINGHPNILCHAVRR